MQTPKKSFSRNGTSEVVPRKTSPVTPHSKCNISAESESIPNGSTSPGIKTPVKMSPKASERKSPKSPASRSPVLERKYSGRVNKLESQLTKLQVELKKTKDQLAASESSRIKVEKEREEVKKQSVAAAEKVEDAQQQLKELAESEDARIEELRMIGQERDKAWQSELEAVKKQHSVDSTALFCALNEVQRLRLQLEVAINSENAKAKKAEVADAEVKSLRLNLDETLCLAENLRDRVYEAEKSEEGYQTLIQENQVQVEIAKSVIDMLRSNGQKATKAYNSMVFELQKSKARASSLEQIMRNYADGQVADGFTTSTSDRSKFCLGMELHSLQLEAEELQTALEMAVTRHQEEVIKHAIEVQSACEEVDRAKVQYSHQQAKLESMILEAKSEVAALQVSLADKEAELQGIYHLTEELSAEKGIHLDSNMESCLKSKLENSAAEIAELETVVRVKESEIENILEENRNLKLEIEKIEVEKTMHCESAKAEIGRANASEQDTLAKIGIIADEADKSLRQAARAKEQLEAAQTANLEMETELRRLRIQSDQWRKAAETAAAMLASGNNGKLMERSGSFPDYNNFVGGKVLNSSFSDDIEDESPKKKHNMLKKFGGLWKKGPK